MTEDIRFIELPLDRSSLTVALRRVKYKLGLIWYVVRDTSLLIEAIKTFTPQETIIERIKSEIPDTEKSSLIGYEASEFNSSVEDSLRSLFMGTLSFFNGDNSTLYNAIWEEMKYEALPLQTDIALKNIFPIEPEDIVLDWTQGESKHLPPKVEDLYPFIEKYFGNYGFEILCEAFDIYLGKTLRKIIPGAGDWSFSRNKED